MKGLYNLIGGSITPEFILLNFDSQEKGIFLSFIWDWGTAYHRGGICASHPAIPSLNPK